MSRNTYIMIYIKQWTAFYQSDITKLLLTLSSRKEVRPVQYITTFLISVMAGIVCYYICKWLDRDK